MKMFSRQQFWIYDRLVRISLQNFAKGVTASRESELLVQAHLLGSADQELEKDQYVESYGVRAIWYFVIAILSSRKSSVTFDDVKTKPFETALTHLEEALKCTFGKKDEDKSFREDLEKLKTETVIHAIGADLNNKTEARRLYNLHRDLLTKFQQDSMKCVLLSLQDFDKTFGSFSDFVKRVENMVQKMLNIIDDTFIKKIAKNCCERLDVKGEDYGKMFENVDSHSDISDDENESNSSFDEKSVGVTRSEQIKKQNDAESHVSSDNEFRRRIPDNDRNISPIKMNDVSEPLSPQRTESIHIKVTSTPISKAKKKHYTFKEPLETNLPVLSSANGKFTSSRASSSVRTYSSWQKHPFTSLQDAYIIMGKQKFDTQKGGWKKMLEYFPFPEYRTATHLKDRWRTLLKQGEVAIENNEIKLSEKYTTLLKYFGPKFAMNEHHKSVIPKQSLKSLNKNSDDSRLSFPKFDRSSIHDLSDTRSEKSGKIPRFNNVEKWIKSSRKESNKSKKQTQLLFERAKQNQDLHNNHAKSPMPENSNKYELVKNSTGKYFRRKSMNCKSESEIPSTSKKTVLENGLIANAGKMPETRPITSEKVMPSRPQQTKVHEKSGTQSIYSNSSKSQKQISNENTADVLSQKSSTGKNSMLSSSKNEIGKSKKNTTLIDEAVTKMGTESTNTGDHKLSDDLKQTSAMSETENCAKNSSGLGNKATDSQRSAKSSHTSTSTFLDPEFESKNSSDNHSQTLSTENCVSEEITSKTQEGELGNERNTTSHPVDDDMESVGHLVIDESSNDSEKKDSIIEESFCNIEDQCPQSHTSDPLRLHLSVMSSQISNPVTDSTNLKNPESDLEDDTENTIIAEQDNTDVGDRSENTKTNEIKSQVKTSHDKPMSNAAEPSTTSQSNIITGSEQFPQSPLSSARSTTSASSDYFTAHEDAISITSLGSSHGNGSTGDNDKTIVNDAVIQDTPNIVEKWVHANSGTETGDGESQVRAIEGDTLELLNQLRMDDESQKSSIKAEPSSKCTEGMFNDVHNSQPEPDTLSLLDNISNAPSQSFIDESEQEHNDVKDSQPNKRIKTEFIAARTRSALKKEQHNYKMLEPPPNEMVVRNINSSAVDKTPILTMCKVKVEPGVFSTNVCMFVGTSGSDVTDLTKTSNDSDINVVDSDEGNEKPNYGVTSLPSNIEKNTSRVDLLHNSTDRKESDETLAIEKCTATTLDNVISEINREGSDLKEDKSDNGIEKPNYSATSNIKNTPGVNLLDESADKNERDKILATEQCTATKPDVLSEINSNGIAAAHVATNTKPDGDALNVNSNATVINGDERSLSNLLSAKKKTWIKVKIPVKKRKVVLEEHGAPVKLSKKDEVFFSGGTMVTRGSETFSTTGKNKRNLRKAWSQEEDDNLLKGVKLYGEGNWKDIFNKFQFENRTAVNLKDRYRILKRA